MSIEWFLDRMRTFGNRDAIILQDRDCVATYNDLLDEIDRQKPAPLSSFAMDDPVSDIALMLSAINKGYVVVPLPKFDTRRDRKIELVAGSLDFIDEVVLPGKPALVVFTSGSTGDEKAILFAAEQMMERYRQLYPPRTRLSFLQLDHLGGIHTVLYTLSNGGTIVVPRDRNPQTICEAIEKYKIEALPVTPTFLNILLASEAYKEYDLSSLRVVTYGTEVMPESVLKRISRELPYVKFKQTYGLSELGVMHVKSRDSVSTWIKITDDKYEAKIQDGTLWVRTEFAMKAYLNAPNPFDHEGWFNTHDKVEFDGEWMRILGRDTDIINVGGLKVYPVEVENVLLDMPGVIDALVDGISNPFTGNAVAVTLQIEERFDATIIKKRVRDFCKGKLESYKIPVLVDVTTVPLTGPRCKKIRTVV